MIRLNPGRFRHKVQVRKRVNPVRRGDKPTYQDRGPVRPAFVEPLRGEERFAAQQLQASVTHKVHMRYTPDVSEKDRLLFGDREFEIAGVIDVEEARQKLELLCFEAK